MPKKDLEVLSIKDFANRIGVSPQSVTRHLRAGHIKERSIQYFKAGGKPKLIVDYAIEDLMSEADPTIVRRTRSGLTTGGIAGKKIGKQSPELNTLKAKAQQVIDQVGDDVYEKKPTIVTDDIEIDFNRDPASLGEARIREAIAKAVKVETEVKVLRGTLVDKSKQDLQLANAATNIKKDLANISDRLGAIVAAEMNPVTCRNLIHAEIEAVLTKHSRKDKIWKS